MKNTSFPLAIFKDSLNFLITPSGGILVLVNFIFCLLAGFGELLIGVLMFGPATFLLQNHKVILWMILPILYVLFMALTIVLLLIQQFVLLVGLHRYHQNQFPMFSIDIFQNEGHRFKLYLKAAVEAAKEIFFGLLKFVMPGVQAFLSYMMIGPVAVFEYQEPLHSHDILKKSATLTQGKTWTLFYIFIVCVGLFMISMALVGRVFTQLFLGPVITAYFTICLVKLYSQRDAS